MRSKDITKIKLVTDASSYVFFLFVICSTATSEGNHAGGKDEQNLNEKPQTNAIFLFQCQHCQLLPGGTG